jgi:hypothetical protein
MSKETWSFIKSTIIDKFLGIHFSFAVNELSSRGRNKLLFNEISRDRDPLRILMEGRTCADWNLAASNMKNMKTECRNYVTFIIWFLLIKCG